VLHGRQSYKPELDHVTGLNIEPGSADPESVVEFAVRCSPPGVWFSDPLISRREFV